MSLLTVNGIELPIARDSLKRGEIEIGSSGRAYSGAAWKSVRARKKTLSLTTTPMALADADAWAALLNGQAVNWSFEADTYSLQGHPASVTGSTARSTAQKKFGTASLTIPGSSSASWSLGLGAEWTIAFWSRFLLGGTTTWRHIVATSDGDIYTNGVTGTTPVAVTVSSGVLSLTYDASYGQTYNDDLIALPTIVPASWPAAMYAHGAQIPASPSLTVAGDLLGSTLTMQARAVEREPLEYSGGVLWRLSVEMEEA